MTNVVITMAGMGKRFRDVGYTCPKYMIEAHGRTLFSWSMLSLKYFILANAHFTFVVRVEDEASGFIKEQCNEIGMANYNIIEIDALTDGQATTALLGGETLCNPDKPFLVYNIDTFVHPEALLESDVHGDGWVPCFSGKGDGWSFASIDNDGRISDLKEKVRISPHATIGLYWFSSFTLYRQVYKEYYSDDLKMEKGEKYIAPMYRQMISDGKEVYIHHVDFDAVIPLGTPKEVDIFLLDDAPIII